MTREPLAPCQSCGFPVYIPRTGAPVCHTCALWPAWEGNL